MIRIAVDPLPSTDDLDVLWLAASGAPAGDYAQKVLPRSLAHEPHLDGFYRECGFRPTGAGLIRL